jgi:hypothetical protein
MVLMKRKAVVEKKVGKTFLIIFGLQVNYTLKLRKLPTAK